MATTLTPRRPSAPTHRRGLAAARLALQLALGRVPDPYPEISRRQRADAAMARAVRRAGEGRS